MRSIAVVTVGRSDYGIFMPVLRRIAAHPDLELRILVSGAHLSPEFGHTVDRIIEDGFNVDERITALLSADTPDAIAISTALGVIGFAQSFRRRKPDILMVLGDRFEMYAAALAALPFAIPVAHVHGGETTEGAIDEALRHSMTKLSHLHFVATDAYARRVVQLGEEPWRVSICGAPALENLRTIEYLSASALAEQFGVQVHPPPLLVTFHPVTLEFDQVENQMTELLAALESVGRSVVFTSPNADTNGRVVIRRIEEYVRAHGNAHFVPNFTPPAYFSMMRLAAAMVGNSSSGLIEAASFGLPVVNVGNRQRGRVRAANVIDVPNDRHSIRAGIERALSTEFREAAKRVVNPYQSARSSAEIIVKTLASVPLDARLITKKFHDLPVAAHV